LVSSPDTQAVLSGLHVDGFFASYAEKLAVAGALPIFFTRESDPARLIERLDGLVLSGGLDVDPRLYGGEPGQHSTQLDPEQDRFEIALTRLAIERGIPILGTCRGHELLNVALGGTLHDHLDQLEPRHRRVNYPMRDRGHAIRFAANSTLHGLYGSSADVNSFHHQAVDQLGDGLSAVAFSDDGVVEAIELKGAHAIGVQWHPEFAGGLEPVLQWLADRARAASSRRDRATRGSA
jgi:putative glutamine amidotransferase